MTTKTTPKTAMVTLDLFPGTPSLGALGEGEGDVPKEFRLFRAGVNETTKGEFLFDEESCRSVGVAIVDWGNDFPVDYGHAMVDPTPVDPAQAGIAAGWFTPRLRDGELWATEVRWTKRAAAYIAAKEYRYISPFFEVDEDRRILRFINVALTNIPATYNLTPLVPASQAVKKDRKMPTKKIAPKKLSDPAKEPVDPKAMEGNPEEEVKTSSTGEAVIAKLTEARDAFAAATDAEGLAAAMALLDEAIEMIADLEAAPVASEDDPAKDPEALSLRLQAAAVPHLKAQVEALSARLAEVENKSNADKRAKVLASHRSRGALTPSMEKDKALQADMAALSVEALDRYLGRFPGLPVGAPRPTRTATAGLSDLDREYAAKFGIPLSAYEDLPASRMETEPTDE